MTSLTQSQSERGFWHLIGLQTQGAFSDNLYKQMLILAVAALGMQASDQAQTNAIVGLIFTLPWLIFSPWAGFLADKFSKRQVTLATKLWEVGVMALGGVAIWLASFPFALFVLFLMSMQSTFFSPSKYGIIPELVRYERLSWANGMNEMTTSLSIISGQAAAAALMQVWGPGGMGRIVGLLVMLAMVGFLTGLRIDRTPAANPTRRFEWNFLPELKRYLCEIRRDRRLFLTVLGLAYFWSLGAVVTLHVNVWGQEALGMSALGGGWEKINGEWVRQGGQALEMGAGWLFVVLALGIAAGSLLAGYLSGDHIEVGLVPIGGAGLALFALPMAFASPDSSGFMIFCLFMMGVSGGLFNVPLKAILQHHTRIEDRGGLIAADNFITFGAMMLSILLYFGYNVIFSPHANVLFLILSGVTLVATYILLRLLPQALLRFVCFLLTRTVYRIRVRGKEHFPAEGPALIVANHTSFVDALLIMAASPRPIRFIVYKDIYQKKALHFLLRVMRCIPISDKQGPKEMMRSLATAGEALEAGEVVCIFAEGQITRTGMLLPFQRGYQYILKRCPAPILPVYLDGIWGSIFSFDGGRFFWKWPRQIPYRVRVSFGEPLASEAQVHELRQAISLLGAETAIASSDDLQTLQTSLIKAARKGARKFAMTDATSPPIKRGQALVRSMIIARRLSEVWGKDQNVATLLPPSVGAALVNFAAALSGRTVVNLNYTIGQEALDYCLKQSGARSVVTSHQFIEKLGIDPPEGAVYLEDYRGWRGMWEVFGAWLSARFAPVSGVIRYCRGIGRSKPEDLATIIFSSGSTGTPKGVMLTHANIVSNVDNIRQAIRFNPEDRLLGVLPFFHSFGYTVSLWAPITLGFSAVYHYNPMDVKMIGELCRKHRLTVMIATPTFLQLYLRKLAPEDFGSVRYVITGAEKLPPRLRTAFKERFGIEPSEGYGTTECSPFVSVNVPHYRAAGFFQTGNKPGSIGHPAPGVAVRVMDVETGELCAPGEEGLLWVKGANIMRGYLDAPEKTAEVLVDGWYNTGDVAYVDPDGFIVITDRLARFSKIGGEMVPHVKVQEAICEALGVEATQVVVSAVPDPAKGERLVVLHTLDEATLDGLKEKLSAAGLPNLFIPRRDMYFKIDAIPVLGTGKLDLKGVKAMALELTGIEKE